MLNYRAMGQRRQIQKVSQFAPIFWPDVVDASSPGVP